MSVPAKDGIELHVLGQGRFLRLVRGADGWEWTERVGARDAVAVIATTRSGEMVLIEEARTPLGCSVISLPAGLIGDDEGTSDESPITAGVRELAEETGFCGEGGVVVQAGPVSPGLTNERVVFVRLRDVERNGPGGGLPGESIVVHVVALRDMAAFLAQRCAEGCEVDHKVHAGLFWLGKSSQELGFPGEIC